MNEHDKNLRDLATMFAIAGLLMRGRVGANRVADEALGYADAFMALRQPQTEPQAEEEPEAGIAALKPKRGAKK
jgi:hypothetical protein